MNGQWIGKFDGTNTGHITLNIELTNNRYEGQAVMVDYNLLIPSITAKVNFEDIGDNNFRGMLSDILPINKNTLLPDLWQNVKDFFDSSVQIPASNELKAHLENNNILNGTWKTNIGTQGKFNLIKSAANQPSTYPTILKGWDEFKEFISTLEHTKYIYRGQSDSWRLRTSYHRTGRSNFLRYNENVNELQHHVCAQTNRIYNLNDPIDYAALLSLGQHHGYPTPLVDWSESPYVAVYFAYSLLPEDHSNKKVRIYIFDIFNWRKNTPQVRHLNSPVLSLTPLKPMPIYNNRSVPQQSVTTFSNVDDIESFIQGYETIHNEKYLTIIELSSNDKKKILTELYGMGINAGSLFPGLDGSCRMLKEKHF